MLMVAPEQRLPELSVTTPASEPWCTRLPAKAFTQTNESKIVHARTRSEYSVRFRSQFMAVLFQKSAMAGGFPSTGSGSVREFWASRQDCRRQPNNRLVGEQISMVANTMSRENKRLFGMDSPP